MVLREQQHPRRAGRHGYSNIYQHDLPGGWNPLYLDQHLHAHQHRNLYFYPDPHLHAHQDRDLLCHPNLYLHPGFQREFLFGHD